MIRTCLYSSDIVLTKKNLDVLTRLSIVSVQSLDLPTIVERDKGSLQARVMIRS